MDVDVAPMVFNDAITDTQPESSTLAWRLGSEKRIEDLITHGRINAAAGVEHMDFHDFHLRATTHRDLATLVAGIDGIGDQVKDNLVDLGWIASDRGQRNEVCFHGDVV